MAHTFGALVGVDLVDFQTQVDRLIWTLGFAHIAVDAFVGDHQCHRIPANFKVRMNRGEIGVHNNMVPIIYAASHIAG
jgi:hypothetical protein